MSTIHQALTLLPLIRGTKRPMLVRWSDPVLDPDMLAAVFAENPGCNVGLRLDGFVVIDCDSPERVAWWLEQGFPTDFMSRGNPARRSFWYRLPDDVELRPRKFSDWEIRSGPGQQCAVAPSIHPDGWRYEWLGPPVDEEHFWEIPQAPVAFLESVRSSVEAPVGAGEGFDVLMEGEGRDNFLIGAAGYMRAKGFSVAAVREGLKWWNRAFCEPPMSSRDLDRISKSSGRWETGSEFKWEEEWSPWSVGE